MNRFKNFKTSAMLMILASFLALPLGVLAQTRVVAPKNSYKVSDDVKLGRDAAMQAERQLPLLNDRAVQNYVNEIGHRLVNALPSEFQHPEFQYSFKVVDARDINAFALPGGFTYVNRGLIEVARNEGELAGVMAHEISHVALRHGTAQAGRARPAAIGSVLGQILGAVVGGGLGQVIGGASQIIPGVYVLKYSREYERNADTLGAQIMARAGYDPRDLANMFRTIEQQSGGSGGAPEWMSSHPNPGNRYDAINREAAMLRVSDTVGDTYEFRNIQARLRDMPRARSMEEIGRSGQRHPVDTRSRPTGRVEYPSSRYRTFQGGNLFQVSVPSNWRDFGSGNEVTFAPEGAYGDYQGRSVITHGMITGVTGSSGRNLRQSTDEFIRALTQGNNRLRRYSNYSQVNLGNRRGLSMILTNQSEVTGGTEGIVVYTTLLRDGTLFYMIGVAPQNEFNAYQNVFASMAQSTRFND